MREIIFRGKDIYTNEWVEGSLILYKKPVTARTLEDSFENHYYIVPFDMGYEVEVDPETIGQWTGETDKNSKKIFEGDIVKTKRHEYRSILKTENLSEEEIDALVNSDYLLDSQLKTDMVSHDVVAKVHYSRHRGFVLLGSNLFVGAICNEVIGNVHDNPELLEAE